MPIEKSKTLQGKHLEALATMARMEGLTLVPTEDLRHVLEHHGAGAYTRSNWCNWPECPWDGEGQEHTCPLKEDS